MIFLLWGMCCIEVNGQNPKIITIDKDKGHHITVSGAAQFWLRYTEMNPGSLVFEREKSSLLDFSLRRYRLNFNGKANERLRYTLVLGNNNVNYYSFRNLQPRILDAYVDYQLTQYFGIGIGKQGFGGPSRYAAPHASQILAYDIDFVSIPLVVVYDDILRRFGIYGRGAYKNWDYRLSLSRPYHFVATNSSPRENQATFAGVRPLYQLSSYVKYQFWDKESQVSPWFPGTYLNKRKIFNIGAGFLYQPNTTWHLKGSDTLFNSYTAFAADLFIEKPLSPKSGINIYLAYLNHNLGTNFIRNIGINNPATGSVVNDYINGRGNNVPVTGTGSIIHSQVGYIIPADSQNTKQLQPYGTFSFGMLEALNKPMVLYNLGFNYYLKEQSSKITFGYENRPVVHQADFQPLRKGMFVLQYQVRF